MTRVARPNGAQEVQMNSLNFKDTKVLIFGLGLNQGGVGSARFFAKAKAKVRVTDLKTKEELQESLDQLQEFPEIEYTLGEHRYEDLDWADLIIKNPAIKPGNPYIEYALKQGKQVEQDCGIFLQFVDKKQIIGITGTKGKSTTASLIYEVLRLTLSDTGGIVFAGNIGKSVLAAVEYIQPDSLVILELSSFQLEAFDQHQTSPHWAIITNISPDHLNYYSSFDEYIQAKKVVAKYQTEKDFLFLNRDDKIISSTQFQQSLRGQVVYFSPQDLPKDFSPKMMGKHNLYNLAASLKVAENLGVDKSRAQKIAQNFPGVEFRLQFIKRWQGVKIYNDSAATNPQATIQALKTFPNSILICGGVNKNLDYHKLAWEITKLAKAVYFLAGSATEEIKKELVDYRQKTEDSTAKIMGTYDNLETLLQDIKSRADPGDTILFSPAAASFNLFKNEFDRGEKFNQTTEKVFGK